MKQYEPRLLKLDFGYGLPGPDVAASRDPALRGERMAYALMQTIVAAAREINPDVTIQYYGIHPLMRPVTDMVTLDDLGDAGGKEAAGHAQWSVWSALAGLQGMAINASSGYDWQCDAEILLNTAVIGAPGAVLPLPLGKEPALPPGAIAHRQAMARWHRHAVGWRPLWLNSEPGSLKSDPQLRCFGRLETAGGKPLLTALALRDEGKESLAAKDLPGVRWGGRWAIISQDRQRHLHGRHIGLHFLGSRLAGTAAQGGTVAGNGGLSRRREAGRGLGVERRQSASGCPARG